jgi:lipopolysaccharide transport protein LptA
VRKPCRVVSSRSSIAALCLLFAGSIAFAAELGRGTFDYSADELKSDLRSDTMELLGNVKLAQDAMSIEASQARASAFRSENSRWSFERAVRLRTADADLKADSARAAFVSGQISTARVEGSPAEFQQRGGQPDRQVRGRANAIDYDFGQGIVTLNGNVWFSYGKDEFCGDRVIYSIRDERVTVNPNGASSGRVKGTIRPKQGSDNRQQAPTGATQPCSESGA